MGRSQMHYTTLPRQVLHRFYIRYWRIRNHLPAAKEAGGGRNRPNGSGLYGRRRHRHHCPERWNYNQNRERPRRPPHHRNPGNEKHEPRVRNQILRSPGGHHLPQCGADRDSGRVPLQESRPEDPSVREGDVHRRSIRTTRHDRQLHVRRRDAHGSGRGEWGFTDDLKVVVLQEQRKTGNGQDVYFVIAMSLKKQQLL